MEFGKTSAVNTQSASTGAQCGCGDNPAALRVLLQKTDDPSLSQTLAAGTVSALSAAAVVTFSNDQQDDLWIDSIVVPDYMRDVVITDIKAGGECIFVFNTQTGRGIDLATSDGMATLNRLARGLMLKGGSGKLQLTMQNRQLNVVTQGVYLLVSKIPIS